MLGTAKDYGVWQLSITQSSGPVSRGSLTERLPFAALYEWQAADVLSRKSTGSKRALIAAYFGGIKDLGPVGLAYAGARVTDPYAKAGLLVASGLWALAQARIAAKAPDPSSTKSHLLPDAGVTGDWDGVIISGLVHGAAKVGPVCQ
jgi:hypothetical protein